MRLVALTAAILLVGAASAMACPGMKTAQGSSQVAANAQSSGSAEGAQYWLKKSQAGG